MNRAVVALLLLALPSLGASQSEESVARPRVKVGDSWTYRGLAPSTWEHASRVSYADDIVIQMVSIRRSDGVEIDSTWTSEWNAVTSYSGRMFRPHSGQFRFPLHVGDRYEWKMDWLEPRTKAIEGISTGEVNVVGWETVEVPAGRFRALRMETEFVIRSPDGRAPRCNGTYWYVPEVKRWVRLRTMCPSGTTGEELLEYKLNQD